MTLLDISSLGLFVGYSFELHSKLKISSIGKYSVAPGVRHVIDTFFGKICSVPIDYLIRTSQSHDWEH